MISFSTKDDLNNSNNTNNNVISTIKNEGPNDENGKTLFQ